MGRIGRHWLGLVLGAGLLWATAPAARACTGDCDADGAVGVAELVTGVRITLGDGELAACPPFDANHDGELRISELIEAVGHALAGCPPTPTATATARPVATDTPDPTATPTLPPVAGVWTEEPLTVTGSSCPSAITDPFTRQLVTFPPCDQTVAQVGETAVTVEDCTGTRVDGSLARDGTIEFAYPTQRGSAPPCDIALTPRAVVPAGMSPTTAVYTFAIAFSGAGCEIADCAIDAAGTWTRQ